MKKTVILAEKPSQATAYAQAFQQSKREEGYFTVTDPLFPEGAVITFGFGHLVELAPPGYYQEQWGKWQLETLPIFPTEYAFRVPKDKQDQFMIVAALIKNADEIIIATDSDREGENIAWSIIHQAGAYSTEKIYKRLWVNSMEKEALREGFAHLERGMDFYPYFQEAQTRQIADWLIGMNASVLYTLSLQKKQVDGTFSVGRVQTPTLYMIYQRQKTIENFTKEAYFEVEALVKAQTGSFKARLSPSERFSTENHLNTYLMTKKAKSGLQGAVITDVQTKEKTEKSPALFSLSGLQSKVNQLYKATASQTLKAVQGLYEAKLLSYPRTDTPYITTNEFRYLKTHFDQYAGFLSLAEPMTQDQPRKRYVNDTRVQEHHAIIPTKQVATAAAIEKMNELQKKIYSLVLKTTVAMFLPDYTFEETVITTKVEELLFKATGKVPKNEGWKQLFASDHGEQKENGQTLPGVRTGEQVQADVQSVQKETQPPKAFTEGTLLTAMKTANKTVDDEEAIKILQEVEGIGTEATRASIIETLKQKEYIKLEKNKLIVTEKGQLLCQAVEKQHLLTSAEMTAKWEGYLKKIGQKQGEQTVFLDNIKKFIVHLLGHVPQDIDSLNLTAYETAREEEAQKSIVGTCPKCGGNIVSKKAFYGCDQYPTCKFSIDSHFRKKKLTKKNLKELLEGNETMVKGIKNKEKNPYNANVKLNSKGYIEFVSFAK